MGIPATNAVRAICAVVALERHGQLGGLALVAQIRLPEKRGTVSLEPSAASWRVTCLRSSAFIAARSAALSLSSRWLTVSTRLLDVGGQHADAR